MNRSFEFVSDFGFRISDFFLLCLVLFVLDASASDPRLAWPPPPAPPRIVFSQTISQPADIRARPSSIIKIANWITGGEQDKQNLVKPFGLALDETGRLLVTDTGANAVFRLDRAAKKWSRWESVDKIRFQSPVAIAAHGESIFVADPGLGKVIAFNEKGKLLFQISEGLEHPSAVAIAGKNLYIADAHRHEVIVCDLTGHIFSRFGQRGAEPGQFNFPSHISADAAGELYVTDSLNSRVQVFEANGRFVRMLGKAGDAAGCFNRPKGASADTLGHLYVVDGLFDNIQIFDQTGQLLLNWGEAGSDPGEFWSPNGIAISRDNEIYVADTYNHRIQVFQFTGKE
jgi:sugar lactone lactonase YvrE